MGAAIRTEIWAALAPGDPGLAVTLAREDSCADHYDDGVEASAFLAALESMAFIEDDRDRLIEAGMSFLKPQGRLYTMFTDVMAWWKETGNVKEVRERILMKYYRQNWTDVGINLSFILLAWYAGEGDFSKSICIAAGLGHDTDCTAATLGAILGILNPGGFEERWTKPLGDDLILSSGIANMHEVSTISKLCKQIAELCVDTLDYYGSPVRLAGAAPLKRDYSPPWAPQGSFKGLNAGYNVLESLISVRPLTVRLTYPKSVALAPGETASFTAVVSHAGNSKIKPELKMRVPDGWDISPKSIKLCMAKGEEVTISFDITAPKNGRRVGRNNLDFNFHMDGTVISVSAGLVRTIDFLEKKTCYDSEECPPDSLFAGSNMASWPCHFKKLPGEEVLYMAEFRPSEHYPEAILAVQGNQPVNVWLDGRLILQHDGCEYVPAFHRSDYVVLLKNLTSDWHKLIVQAKAGVSGEWEESNPKNAIVPVPGTIPTAELRRKYDSEKLYSGHDRELFIALAGRTGTRWISEMEWRKPVVVKDDTTLLIQTGQNIPVSVKGWS